MRMEELHPGALVVFERYTSVFQVKSQMIDKIVDNSQQVLEECLNLHKLTRSGVTQYVDQHRLRTSCHAIVIERYVDRHMVLSQLLGTCPPIWVLAFNYECLLPTVAID